MRFGVISKILLVLSSLIAFSLSGHTQDDVTKTDNADPALPGNMRFADPEADFEADVKKAAGSINPLENDLRDIEIVFRLHEAFLISERRQAELVLRVDTSSGQVAIDEVFELIQIEKTNTPFLESETRDEFYMAGIALNEGDKVRMGETQQTLERLKQTSDGNNALSLNAVAYTCASPEGEVPDVYSATTYIRTHPDVDFIPLSSELLVDKTDDPAIAALWNVCED